jgi:hypothetical protein
MSSIPQLSMLSEGRVRMRGELGLELRQVGAGNRGLGTRWSAGTEVLTAALFGQPAFEGTRTDCEGAEHLGTRHPARHRR